MMREHGQPGLVKGDFRIQQGNYLLPLGEKNVERKYWPVTCKIYHKYGLAFLPDGMSRVTLL